MARERLPTPNTGDAKADLETLAEHARALVRLLRGSRAKVNLIPLNPAPQIPFEAPPPEAVDRFCKVLADAHLTVSVRKPRGQDILAACGQLHLKRGETPASVSP